MPKVPNHQGDLKFHKTSAFHQITANSKQKIGIAHLASDRSASVIEIKVGIGHQIRRELSLR